MAAEQVKNLAFQDKVVKADASGNAEVASLTVSSPGDNNGQHTNLYLYDGQGNKYRVILGEYGTLNFEADS